jgi:hypothetical protein
VSDWLGARTGAAPERLRERVAHWVSRLDAPEAVRDGLARAATDALDAVVAHDGDRSVALDLLAADALITLALLHQAEHHPEDLGRYAEQLVAVPLEPTRR